MWMPSRSRNGEGQRRWRSTARGSHPVHRGMEDGTKVQKQGVNWGTSRSPPEAGPWVGGATRECISGWKRARGSDEAIVSDEVVGHYNPPRSQGPLDGIDQSDETLCRLKRVYP